MVFLTRIVNKITQENLGKHLKKPFIDKLRIFIRGGSGGKASPKLGGIGGNGGSVILEAKSTLTLKDVYASNLKKRYFATHGENSKRMKLFGAHGEDVIVKVPCGITAYKELGHVYLGELNQENERLVVARGGSGACVENNYQHEECEPFMIYLDLKLIADVGLIGFPNAGKSTFLSLVSRAQPKIANYPFTTLNPQLGTIEYEDKRIITIADLPGIIEGAHVNRGMGHKFLKHISRTKLNVFMVDINGFQLNQNFDARSAFETVILLNKELELYDESLVGKPSILLLNKVDVENAQEKCKKFYEDYNNYDKSIEMVEDYWRPTKRVNFNSIVEVSVKENKNIDKACLEIRELLDQSTHSPSKDNTQSKDSFDKLI